MNTTNQNPQFINSYFSALLHYKSFNQLLWDYNAADLQAWMLFRNSDIFGKSIPTMTPDGSFNTPIKNVQTVQAVIASATQSGNNLILTFTDATYASFRKDQKVSDHNMFEGYVLQASPGTITVGPLNNPSTTLTAGTHFPANTTIRANGKIAANFNSVGTTTLYDQKDVQVDWSEITRDTCQIARREKQNLFESTTTAGEKVFYGYTDTEANTFNRFLWECAYKYMFGKGGTGLQLSDGVASKTYGIRNRIIDNSGNYISSNAPMTQAQFESMVLQAASVNPAMGSEILLMPGRRALQQIGTFYPSQMAFAAAERRNDKMSVSLDTREVFIAGINVKVLTNFSLLNSEKIEDWHKDSVYVLNMAPTNMNGQKAKMVQLIHTSDDPNSTSEVIRKETPGMTGSGQGNNTGMGNIGQNQVTASPVDGTTVEFLDDSGVAMVAKGQGLFEFKH